MLNPDAEIQPGAPLPFHKSITLALDKLGKGFLFDTSEPGHGFKTLLFLLCNTVVPADHDEIHTVLQAARHNCSEMSEDVSRLYDTAIIHLAEQKTLAEEKATSKKKAPAKKAAKKK